MGSALITGAAIRLGREMALMLARRGWSIALHYHRSEADAVRTAHEITSLGVKCTPLQADLADARAVEALVGEAKAMHSDLELLINSASLFEAGCLRDTSVELWNRQLDVNVRAPFLLSRDFVRQVGRGQIINLLDSQVDTQRTSHAAYLLSKKALTDLTLMSAREWGPEVRVNGLALGPFLTPSQGDGSDLNRRLATHPMGRCGTLAELETGLFSLLENGYLTGQILYLDGGDRL